MRAAAVLLAAALAGGCGRGEHGAYAHRIVSRTDLIGGPHALGEVGDYVLGNEKIRVIVQQPGWSRGFSMFGGGIVDADLTRPGSFGTNARGTGKDNFGELFPALFLQAFDVSDREVRDPETGEEVTLPAMEVLADGSGGGPAVIRTRASGADFITMLRDLVDLVVPAGLLFETDFILEPGARHVKIVGRVRNVSGAEVSLPNAGVIALLRQLGMGSLQAPLGDILLFGGGNEVFAPGAVAREGKPPKPVGFDLRYSVDTSYLIHRELPAIPGLPADFLAAAGPDVSYGFALEDSDRNFVWMNREEYEKDTQFHATRHSMLVPVIIEAFTGAFAVVPPETLAPSGDPEGRDRFEYARYFIVGNGDVASIRDEIYRIRGVPTGRLFGRITNAQTGRPESEASLVILDAEKRPFSQVRTDAGGRFTARLEPGTYYYRVTAPGRDPFPDAGDELGGGYTVEQTRFTIACRAEGCSDHEERIELPPPAELVVAVRDSTGRALPAKVSLVARFRSEYDGMDPMDFLFDLSLGESRRVTDLTWKDPPSRRTHRYVEGAMVTSNGLLHERVRPSCRGDRCEDDAWKRRVCGDAAFREQACAHELCRFYDVYVSRGPEYDLHVEPCIWLAPGKRTTLDAVLTRVVDTTDWLAADLHMHSRNSVDSFLAVEDRIAAVAAEGLEMPIAADHNWVTDYRPAIASLGLEDWMTAAAGVELTTMERGHFNAFPLEYDQDAPTHFPYVATCNERSEDKVSRTAFDYLECTPQQMFDNVRELGVHGPRSTIVQVNHPRDGMLGYFSQYYVNAFTLESEAPDLWTGERPGWFDESYPTTGFPLHLYPHSRANRQFAADAFSWDFDALEVLNSKRLDLLHAFRISPAADPAAVARLQDPCSGGHPLNGAGTVRLRQGGHIAYPGAVDDWLRLLNEGATYTATGNSDSHRIAAEVGTARTYIHVEPAADGSHRDRSPGAVTDLDLVEAIHDHRAIVSNGPFLDMHVVTRADDGGDPVEWPVGSTVRYNESNVGKAVTIVVTVRSAPWIRVDRVVLWANYGLQEDRVPTVEDALDPAPLAVLQIPHEKDEQGRDADDDWSESLEVAFDRDVVLVAEAFGDESMFPVETPTEEPPSNADEAIGALGAGLGLTISFSGGDGLTGPSYVEKVTPYALTNPIWLDIDANGRFDPPGNAPGPEGVATPPASACPEQEPAAAGTWQSAAQGTSLVDPQTGRVDVRSYLQ